MTLSPTLTRALETALVGSGRGSILVGSIRRLDEPGVVEPEEHWGIDIEVPQRGDEQPRRLVLALGMALTMTRGEAEVLRMAVIANLLKRGRGVSALRARHGAQRVGNRQAQTGEIAAP